MQKAFMMLLHLLPCLFICLQLCDVSAAVYAFPAGGRTTANRVWLLQNGASAGFHPENVGSLDLSKLTAVSFAAMRLEIGAWQVAFRPKLTFAYCTELLLMIVHNIQLLQHQVF